MNKKQPQKRKKNIKGSAKPALVFSAYQNNLDTMKLLVSYPDFKEEVAKARIYLDIPPSGIIGNNEAQKWHRSLEKKSDDMLSSNEFVKQEANIKEKLINGEINLRMASKQSKLLYDKIPINYLTNLCKYLAEKFNLPEHFEYYIRVHILYNAINAPPTNYVTEYANDHGTKKMRSITVKIYTKFTDAEFEFMTKEVKRLSEGLPRFNKLKNVDKKLEYEQWAIDREHYDFAEEKSYTISKTELAKEIFGSADPKKAYEEQRSLNRARNKRFGKK